MASGTGSILARGVCYSTSANPNIASSLTQQSTGSGAYNEFVTNLQPNTTYYLRAFATNSLGTSYGNQVVFKTKKVNVVGDTLGGGIIAYILAPGDQGYVMGEQHGLIALPWDYFNISLSYAGSCGTWTSASTSQYIGDGAANTNSTYTACSSATTLGAVQVAYNLVANGQSDWHIPSSDELNKLLLSSAFNSLALTNGQLYFSSYLNGTSVNLYRRMFIGYAQVEGISHTFSSSTALSGGVKLRVVRYF